jgi:hypothetical protein
MTVKLRICPKFAASNIYWNGTRLTFDPYSATANLSSEQKQGVMFKWGSLIGIAAAGKANSQFVSWNNDSTIYVPTSPSSPITGHTAWTKTTTTAAQSVWTSSGYAGIPYVDATVTIGSSTDRDNNYLTTLHSSTSAAAYKGDICYYLNSAYRMPTGAECPMPEFMYWIPDLTIPDSKPSNSVATAIDGQTPIPVSGNHGRFLTTPTTSSSGLWFPASGSRLNTGHLGNVGTTGRYWCSSGGGTTTSWYIFFSGITVGPVYSGDRLFSCAVRCVLR